MQKLFHNLIIWYNKIFLLNLDEPQKEIKRKKRNFF